MPTVEESVTTPLTPAEVFDYIANFENIVEWDPGVTAAKKVDDEAAGPGSAYDLDLNYGGSDFTMRYTITEFERPTLVTLVGEGSRSTAVDRISFVPVENGTRVHYEADIRLRGLYRMAEPFLGKLFAKVGAGARDGLDRRLRELSTELKGS